MVSSPVLWLREEPEVFLDSENPVSRGLPSRYQVNYPPDSWEVLFNVSSPFTYASPLVGSRRVASIWSALSCLHRWGRGGRKLLPPQSEGQHSPVRQRLRPRTPLKSRLSCLVSMERSRFMLGWPTRPSQIKVV